MARLVGDMRLWDDIAMFGQPQQGYCLDQTQSESCNWDMGWCGRQDYVEGFQSKHLQVSMYHPEIQCMCSDRQMIGGDS
jgi:hypothetical protein